MWPVFMKNSPTSCCVFTLRSSHGFCVTKIVAALLRHAAAEQVEAGERDDVLVDRVRRQDVDHLA